MHALYRSHVNRTWLPSSMPGSLSDSHLLRLDGFCCQAQHQHNQQVQNSHCNLSLQETKTALQGNLSLSEAISIAPPSSKLSSGRHLLSLAVLSPVSKKELLICSPQWDTMTSANHQSDKLPRGICRLAWCVILCALLRTFFAAFSLAMGNL